MGISGGSRRRLEAEMGQAAVDDRAEQVGKFLVVPLLEPQTQAVVGEAGTRWTEEIERHRPPAAQRAFDLPRTEALDSAAQGARREYVVFGLFFEDQIGGAGVRRVA